MQPVLVETTGSSLANESSNGSFINNWVGTVCEPKDHSGLRSAARGFLSYPSVLSQIPMFHTHISRGTGYEAIRTGVVSSGVVMGVQELFNFTPLPKSKSQIFTGDTFSGDSHSMFSGFRSR